MGQLNVFPYTVCLIIAAAIGIYVAGVVPIYGQPFAGCMEQTLLSLDPHYGSWPESLRNVLLVAPPSVLVRNLHVLAGYTIMVIILGSLGGITGIRFGEYSTAITDPTSLLYNLHIHIITTGIFPNPKTWGGPK